jgi:alkylhydroperoxidase family enzyme
LSDTENDSFFYKGLEGESGHANLSRRELWDGNGRTYDLNERTLGFHGSLLHLAVPFSVSATNFRVITESFNHLYVALSLILSTPHYVITPWLHIITPHYVRVTSIGNCAYCLAPGMLTLYVALSLILSML